MYHKPGCKRFSYVYANENCLQHVVSVQHVAFVQHGCVLMRHCNMWFFCNTSVVFYASTVFLCIVSKKHVFSPVDITMTKGDKLKSNILFY